MDTMDITTLMDIIMIVIGDNSRDIPTNEDVANNTKECSQQYWV
jgi:hypothetical protein